MRKREGEQPRRGAGTEREAAHAGQIVRRHERDQRQQDQRHAAVDVLRVLHPQQARGDRDADGGEDDDASREPSAERDCAGGTTWPSRTKPSHGQNRAANQIVLPLSRRRTRPIP